MGEGFKKFKRKMCVGAWIRGSLLGVAVGCVIAAVLTTLSKFEILTIDKIIMLIASVAPAVAVAGIVVLVLMPSEKRAAKKIDRALNFGERAQTMVAYKQHNGPMIALQRVDADNRLSAATTRGVGLRGIVAITVAFVLAAAMLVTAFVIPGKAEALDDSNEEIDIPWAISEYQRVALEDLIREVRESEMEQEAKDSTVDTLEDLLYALTKVVETESEMKETVIAAIVDVDLISDNANTYLAISRKMLESEDDSMQKLGKIIELLDPLSVRDKMDVLYVSNFMVSDVADLATAFAAGIELALEGAMTDNEIYLNIALYNFADSLRLVGSDGDSSNDGLQTDNAFATACDDLVDALSYQKTNLEMRDKVIAKLTELFGIKADELPDLNANLPSDGNVGGDKNDENVKPEDDEDEVVSDGGIGTGNIIYGSDESYIYDPEKKETVLYGESLGAYHGKYLEDVLSGQISDEFKDLLDAYFDVLFSGTEDKE